MKYRNRIAACVRRRADFDRMKVKGGLERGYHRPGSQRRSK